MTAATFRSVRLDSVPGASTSEIGWNCNELLSSHFQGWKTSSPKNHFKVILQQMGELLELRARSGTAEKYLIVHIAAGSCRRHCHKSLCLHYPKFLIEMKALDNLMSPYLY